MKEIILFFRTLLIGLFAPKVVQGVLTEGLYTKVAEQHKEFRAMLRYAKEQNAPEEVIQDLQELVDESGELLSKVYKERNERLNEES